nr:MAG TPA: hypothetical protein [Caudoviricetes sp.]
MSIKSNNHLYIFSFTNSPSLAFIYKHNSYCVNFLKVLLIVLFFLL